jgi:hypothetical protein
MSPFTVFYTKALVLPTQLKTEEAALQAANANGAGYSYA